MAVGDGDEPAAVETAADPDAASSDAGPTDASAFPYYIHDDRILDVAGSNSSLRSAGGEV